MSGDLETRGATRSEYRAIEDVIRRAFNEDELDLWQYLVDNDPSLKPEGIRVRLADGKVVACTVVLPRTIMTRAGWLPAALITLVACDPEYQRQGHGGATVLSALEYCKAEGLALGLLYGHPGYYPRFGFAPVLPWLWTELDTAALRSTASRLGGRGGVELAAATPADIPELNELFEHSLATYPMAVRRGPEEWVWRDRNGAGKAIWVIRDGGGTPVAYARTSTDARYPGVSIASEAVVAESKDAVGLVTALVARAAEQGFERLRLTLPPGETLTRAAILLGAEQRYRPATSGMAAVTHWHMALPEGYSVTEAQGGDGGLLLAYRGRPALAAPHSQMVQLTLGYRGAGDLALMPGNRFFGKGADRDRLFADFPALYPRWTLAPCW